MTVKGLSRLQRKLVRLRESTKEEIAKALEKGAEEIADLARSLVPIDEMVLYDSIGWTWGEPPKGSITLARSRSRADGLKISVYAGNDEAYYARWVEFGTAPHGVAKDAGKAAGRRLTRLGIGGLQHPGAAAQPFFYPAYRAVRRRVRSRITRATNSAAKKVAGRG